MKKKHKLTDEEMVRLIQLPLEQRAVATKLLATRIFRSRFREAMCQVLRNWLAVDKPRNPVPFSPAQLKALNQTWG